jgi:hypothetical protein
VFRSSVFRSSALLTRLFHCGSLRRSAKVSKSCSGGHAIRVVVVTRTARRYHCAFRLDSTTQITSLACAGARNDRPIPEPQENHVQLTLPPRALGVSRFARPTR